MSRLLATHYTTPANLRARRAEFNDEGYVHLGGLFEPSAFAVYAREVMELKAASVARDFVMPGTGTARRLSTVGGTSIKARSGLLSALYDHPEILKLVRELAGREVFACQHKEEFMVANYLLQLGATHGWHLDDPDFALVLFFESSPPSRGGQLEYIPRWEQIASEWGAGCNLEEAVAAARSRGLVLRRSHRAGDGYLLHASRVLHRVTSLRSSRHHRSVLNLAYQGREHIFYGESASLLYGGVSATMILSG